MTPKTKKIIISAFSILVIILIVESIFLYKQRPSTVIQDAPVRKVLSLGGNSVKDYGANFQAQYASTSKIVTTALIGNNIDLEDISAFALTVCGKKISKEALYGNLNAVVSQGIIDQPTLTKILSAVTKASMKSVEAKIYITKEIGLDKVTKASAIFCNPEVKKISTWVDTENSNVLSLDTNTPKIDRFKTTSEFLNPILQKNNIDNEDIRNLLSQTCNKTFSYDGAYTKMVNTVINLNFTESQTSTLFSTLGKGRSLQTAFGAANPGGDYQNSVKILCN